MAKLGAKYEEKKFFLNRTLTGRCSIRNYDYCILFLIDKIWHFVKSSRLGPKFDVFGQNWTFWAKIWRFRPKFDGLGQNLTFLAEIWHFRPDFDGFGRNLTFLGQNLTFLAEIWHFPQKFNVFADTECILQNLTYFKDFDQNLRRWLKFDILGEIWHFGWNLTYLVKLDGAKFGRFWPNFTL